MNQCPVEKFVCTKQKNMTDAWYLVSDSKGLSGSNIYSKRWLSRLIFVTLKTNDLLWGWRQPTLVRQKDGTDYFLFQQLRLPY